MRLPGFALAIASLATVAFTSPAMTQTRSAPLRIIYPFAGGGFGDALARLIADRLIAALERPVIVEPRAGAAGRLGVQAVKASEPDGNTLLVTPIAPMAVYQSVYPSLDYDPVKDFVPITQVATFDFSVCMAEGKSGKGQFRHAGRRHPPPFLRSHVRESHRGAAATHRLQGRHACAYGHDGRPDPDGLPVRQ
jgi:tripartite-type tricarboxylate transporter receptor subunit TctC